MGQINTGRTLENAANRGATMAGGWQVRMSGEKRYAGWVLEIRWVNGKSISMKLSITTRWFSRQTSEMQNKMHTRMWPRRHACKTKTHTLTCVLVGTTDVVWTVVFSAVKEGPEGLFCLTVHQGSAVTQWHQSPRVTHNAVRTPPCLCECVSRCVAGFHHVKHTTADLFMSVIWHCLVHLYAPLRCNVSAKPISRFFRCFKMRVFFLNNCVKSTVGCCIVCKVSPCFVSVYKQRGSWDVLWVVLLIFGQLRPCFPQGKSLTPASTCSHSGPLLSYSCIYGPCSWKHFHSSCISIHFGQQWKVKKCV